MQDPTESRKELILELLQQEKGKPCKWKELAAFLQVPKEERMAFRLLLEELQREGKIVLHSNGTYTLPLQNQKVGIFLSTQKGFGFVRIEGEEDVFIAKENSKGAFHGDLVQIVVQENQKRKHADGKVITILQHNQERVVGTFEKNKQFGFVIPDDMRIGTDLFVAKENSKGAMTGHKVVAKIIRYGSKDKKPEAKIIRILGHRDDPGVDILSVIEEKQIPVAFSKEVKNQIKQYKDFVTEEEKQNRLDLRDALTITIDGEDAKDLDDAITLQKQGEHYLLGVHIADVSHYVTEGSALDLAAKERGTSVYLVDRVIPMLPRVLSNGICSLNANEDRLTLSCIMEVNTAGSVVDYRIAETLICVDKRMNYTEVNQILTEKEKTTENSKELIAMLNQMQELSLILRKKREQRGAISFDFAESKIELDQQGVPIAIHPYERNEATKLIESFMLLANETIAQDYFWQEMPFVYRTHEEPDLEKMKELAMFICHFGYTIKLGKEEMHPKELQKLLMRVEQTKEDALICRVVLRSMKRAKYDVVCKGHFGLATQYYCHFTSPIRRYPDLQIHRIIKENLRSGMTEKRRKQYEKKLPKVAAHCSMTERRAEEAERDVEKMKKAEYMKQYIGHQFEGIISGMNRSGIYVTLPNTVEGMVPVSALQDDYYEWIQSTYQMVGERTGKMYQLGQTVTIEVVSVDEYSNQIEFMILSA